MSDSLHAVSQPDGIKLELVWTPPGTYDYQSKAS